MFIHFQNIIDMFKIYCNISLNITVFLNFFFSIFWIKPMWIWIFLFFFTLYSFNTTARPWHLINFVYIPTSLREVYQYETWKVIMIWVDGGGHNFENMHHSHLFNTHKIGLIRWYFVFTPSDVLIQIDSWSMNKIL